MLGATRCPVAQVELGEAARGEVLEVPPSCSAADPCLLRDVRSRKLLIRLAQDHQHAFERRPRDSLWQASAAARPEQRVQAVDIGLLCFGQSLETCLQCAVGLEPLAQCLERERFDEVVDDAGVHRRAQRLDIFRRCDRDDVDLRLRALAQLAHDLQATHVRQVDVEQDEIRPKSLDGGQGIHSGMRLADDLEAGHALDERTVNARDHEVVVDDEDTDHASAGSSGSRVAGVGR